MINLKITDVRALPADSAFLIDNGKTAILYDSGFGFTGLKVAENIKRELGSRKLDYIFLTHSHYDHALGAAYVLEVYPNAKIVAGEYAQTIFQKSTAKATMRELDRKFAQKCDVTEYPDLTDNLKVDIPVSDGDEINCGDMKFTAVNLPGHTKCSVGFYQSENKLLLSCETLGVSYGDKYLPAFLVGFGMTLDSFKKAKELDIENILVPHRGLISGENAKEFIEKSEKAATKTAEMIKELFLSGLNEEEVFELYKNKVYTEEIKPYYPIDAFNLNSSIMIRLIKNELL